MAQATGELELARTARATLEQRLMGAKTRSEVDELMRRLDAAEQIATQRFNGHANLSYRSEVGVCYSFIGDAAVFCWGATHSEVDELMRQLDAAEQIATQGFNDHANLSYRSEVVFC